MGDLDQTLKIVVGHDGSEAARRGLTRARHLAAGRPALVVVVAVVPDAPSAGLDAGLSTATVEPEPLLARTAAPAGRAPEVGARPARDDLGRALERHAHQASGASVEGVATAGAGGAGGS